MQAAGPLEHALLYLEAAALHMPDRMLPLLAEPTTPVLLYTDASAKGRTARLGALLIREGYLDRATVFDPP